jgi:hypothetical protein
MWKTTAGRFAGVLVIAFCVCAASGCKKSATDRTGSDRAEAEGNSTELASVHWLGTKRIAADTNAAQLVRLWNLPESRRLVSQTLDKLALAPWRAEIKGVNWQTVTNYGPLVSGNAHAQLLRPLLDDLLASECHLRAANRAKDPVEFALAVRLDPARAGVWTKNLGILSKTKGALLSGVQFSAQGEWMIVSSEKAGDRIVAAIREAASTPITNAWASSVFNVQNLVRALDLSSLVLANLPEAEITIGGHRNGVRTRGELRYPRPLQIELDPWIVPTNMINEPLIGFAALRGIRSFLGETEFWKDHKLGTPPNQAFFWAQRGPQWLHYFALPSGEADAQVRKLGDWITNDLNSILEPNRLGTMISVPGANGFAWKGIPLFFPNIGFESRAGQPFIKGGFFKPGMSNGPMPAELVKQLQSGTNIVWYDWELTGPCVAGWMAISQISKHTLGYARLTHKPAFEWLGAVGTNLANCTTVVKMEDRSTLSLARDSGVGFNAVELHLLADWLESPDFPAGLRTLRADRPPPLAKRAGHWSSYALSPDTATNTPAPKTNKSAPKKSK